MKHIVSRHFESCQCQEESQKNVKKTSTSQPGLDLGQFVHLHTLFEPMDGWRIQVIGMRHQTIGQLHHGNGKRSYLQKWKCQTMSNLWYAPGPTGCGWKWTLHWYDCSILIERLQPPSCGIHPPWMNAKSVPLATRATKERHKYNQPQRDEKLHQWMMVAGTTPRSIDHAPWETLAVHMWRATLCINRHDTRNTYTHLKLYPSRQAINIRCPKIKSLHNVISTRNNFVSSPPVVENSSTRPGIQTWVFEGLVGRGVQMVCKLVGSPWTPTQRSTDAPSIGPQWTFLLRDVPLERSETPELQTHWGETSQWQKKKSAPSVPPRYSMSVVLTYKHVVTVYLKNFDRTLSNH